MQSPRQPPRPQLQTPRDAPQAARIISQVALRYDPDMTPQARDRDFLEKIALAKKLLSVDKLPDLRQQSLDLLSGRGEVSWETLRCLRWPQGDRVGVVLSIPVWVPSKARRVQAFAGFEKRWQTVALCQPRPSCFVWFDGQLADVNNKARYRPERTLVEMNSRFAPLAGLLLEYIFREGWYDQSKRVPLLVVRAGEDTWSVPASAGPEMAECLSYPDKFGPSLDACVVQGCYDSLAELHHGRHVLTSNHRLGLAMDINDFNFKNVVDGTPNPVSRPCGSMTGTPCTAWTPGISPPGCIPRRNGWGCASPRNGSTPVAVLTGPTLTWAPKTCRPAIRDISSLAIIH